MGNIAPVVVSTLPKTPLLLKSDGYKSKEVTVPNGSVVTRYSAVGIRTINTTISVPVVSGTGNGTMANIAAKAKTKVGTYKVRCIRAATDAGLFEVIDPDGVALGTVEAAASPGGAFLHAQIGFNIIDGSTDFAVGDSFSLVVAAGTGLAIIAVATAIDGSQHIVGFAPTAIDAATPAANTKGLIIERGHINEDLAVLDASFTLNDALRSELAAKGLILESTKL